MFDLAINTTLDPKTLIVLPKSSSLSLVRRLFPLPGEKKGFCDFWVIREGVSEFSCSLVYSSELCRGQEDIFVETMDSS
ncbi:hypothetical protein GQ457_14G016690 [Hibiscus cannabinus]